MTDAPDATAVDAVLDTVTIQHAGGSLTVPAQSIVHLSEALWGFPDRLDYALLPGARQGLWWFMSTGEPQVSFVLADPFVVDPDYVVDLGELEKHMLGITDANDVLALIMLALPAAPQDTVTGNFRAPIVINLRTRRAMQIISRDDSHGMKQPVDLTKFPRDDENGVAFA
jgi:flagellar assembly factor FliW